MRCLLSGIIAYTLLLCGGTFAQEKSYSKVMMILFRGTTQAETGFMDHLRGRLPVEFLVRDVAGARGKVREFVEEARRERVDLIYTFGTSVALDVVGAAGKVDPAVHVTDIPVVFNIVADPVGAGLAPAFAATGRNLTGVSHLVPMADQLRAMQRFRQVTKLGVIYNASEPNSTLAVTRLRGLAAQFKFQLVEEAITSGPKPEAAEVAKAMQPLIAARPGFIYLPSDSSLIERAAAIVELARPAGIPIISATEGPIREDGALMGLVSNYANAGAFPGYKAEQILRGKEAVRNIPIETLQRFTLLVNMTTAVQLGVYPPLDLIKIAELL
jgi:putative tryptophan/tyrosine transport system substrate-binding protein